MNNNDAKKIRDRMKEIDEEIIDLEVEKLALERLLKPQNGKLYTHEEIRKKLGLDDE